MCLLTFVFVDWLVAKKKSPALPPPLALLFHWWIAKPPSVPGAREATINWGHIVFLVRVCFQVMFWPPIPIGSGKAMASPLAVNKSSPPCPCFVGASWHRRERSAEIDLCARWPYLLAGASHQFMCSMVKPSVMERLSLEACAWILRHYHRSGNNGMPAASSSGVVVTPHFL
jgi:hypothetical protein